MEQFSKTQQFFKTQTEKEKSLKNLKKWANNFLNYTFDVIHANLECFSIGDFKEESLFFSLEGMVCDEFRYAEKSPLGLAREIEKDAFGNENVTIDAESFLRDLFAGEIEQIWNSKLTKITDKKQVPRMIDAGIVCKNMTSSACDEIFGLEKQKMLEDLHEAKNPKAKTEKTKNAEISL